MFDRFFESTRRASGARRYPSCVSVSLANIHPAFGGSWADEVEDTIGKYSFPCPKPSGEAWRHSVGVSLIVSVAILP